VSKHKKRKRQRSTAPQVPPRPPRRVAEQRAERPKAPWHPVPLVELCVLVGIVLTAVGFFTDTRTLMALGICLAALGGLDTAAREHFSGYRPHGLVLAGVPAIAAAVVTAFAGAPLLVVVPVMVAVFVAALLALRRAWERSRARAPA
jgi:hypothetical protein